MTNFIFINSKGQVKDFFNIQTYLLSTIIIKKDTNITWHYTEELDISYKDTNIYIEHGMMVLKIKHL